MTPFRSRIELRNASHVQDVFRPSVHGAGHDAEEVLHAARHPRPVMRLQLRHRDDEIRLPQLRPEARARLNQ